MESTEVEQTFSKVGEHKMKFDACSVVIHPDRGTYNRIIEWLRLFEAVATKIKHTDRHVPTALEKSPVSAQKMSK